MWIWIVWYVICGIVMLVSLAAGLYVALGKRFGFDEINEICGNSGKISIGILGRGLRAIGIFLCWPVILGYHVARTCIDITMNMAEKRMIEED